MWFGSLFQSLDPKTEKALSANVIWLILGTTGEQVLFNRTCLRPAPTCSTHIVTFRNAELCFNIRLCTFIFVKTSVQPQHYPFLKKVYTALKSFLVVFCIVKQSYFVSPKDASLMCAYKCWYPHFYQVSMIPFINSTVSVWEEELWWAIKKVKSW